jgi:O-methyltransferase
MSGTSIGLSPSIQDYVSHFGYREAAILAALREETARLGGPSAMQIAPEQGAFMGLVAGLMGARHILEIGTFTGYSSLAMALGSAARIIAVDVSEEWTAVARKYWKRASVQDRIDLRLDGGHNVIADLLHQDRMAAFDLVFIDADKPSYDAYYEGALSLLRPGGLVMIDNVLWSGAVADPAKIDTDTNAIRNLNAKIHADVRVTMALVPIGDGITMARKN